ncbi:MAG: putative rane transporter protein [Cyanobacteriota bacterium erpe_2018_sw_21hr_WHONDRS-SW48-000092_B_bin.40]|nr:putative rane transporter protein [Cyanobacteriota bacterium erpe_2018_sw_21hr_WHONDRS-SW48-000092_B_bin.40]
MESPAPLPAPASEPELPMAGPPKLKISGPIRLLAIASALVIVAAAVGIASGIVAMRNFFLQAIDPKYMRETATFITGLADPVPVPGFNQVMAAKLTKAVIFLENPKDKTQVSFWRYEGEDLDAVQELDRAYDMGIWTPTNWAKFQSITSKGKTEINGKTITYVQGPLKDQAGDTYEGLIACTIEGDNIVLLQAMQPSDRPFDREKVLAWLARPL